MSGPTVNASLIAFSVANPAVGSTIESFQAGSWTLENCGPQADFLRNRTKEARAPKAANANEDGSGTGSNPIACIVWSGVDVFKMAPEVRFKS